MLNDKLVEDLMKDYIVNIPSNSEKGFELKFVDDYNRYETILGNLFKNAGAEDNYQIDFQSDSWDFRFAVNTSSDYHLNITFNGIPEAQKLYVKFFAIYCFITRGIKPSTVNSKITSLRAYFNSLSDLGYTNLEYVDTDAAIKIFDDYKTVSYDKANRIVKDICLFYEFMFSSCYIKYPINLNVLYEFSQQCVMCKTPSEKTPDIPVELFTGILNKVIELMRDCILSYDMRSCAALLVLLTQTGFRPSDLVNLRVSDFRKNVYNNGTTVYYMHYIMNKTTKFMGKSREFDIVLTSLAVEAIEILIELRKDTVYADTDFLYVLPSEYNEKALMPVSTSIFVRHYHRLLSTYCFDLINQEWDGIKKVKLSAGPRGCYNHYYSVPSFRQYRVHFATELYNKGVPLEYIKRFLGHMTHEMEGYYVRPIDKFVENYEFTESVLEEIVVNDVVPLGLNGKELKDAVQNFLKDDKVNVVDDYEQLVEKLGNRLTIRAKDGGACIKCSLVPCSEDAGTNEYMCSYGLCPNLFHFYFTADLTYTNFINAKKTYELNISNGKAVAASKELKKLQNILKSRLIPELNQLDEEIMKRSEDTILLKYPSLRYIIENRVDIRKEIERWLGMNTM